MFLHKHCFYPFGKDPDSQVLIVLIDQLRSELEIESCGAKKYARLIQRLADRISDLVKALWNDGLIRPVAKYIFERSETFESYWKKRLEIWNGRFNVVSPSSTRESSPVVGAPVVGSMNKQPIADTGYLTGGLSVVSNNNQQAIRDSGYWTAGKGRDLESTGSPDGAVSQWGGDMWKDSFYPVKSASITVPQQPDAGEEYSNYHPASQRDRRSILQRRLQR